MRSVIEEIAAERQRQIDGEGWTTEHDDEHSRGEMANAAACYAAAEITAPCAGLWPWPDSWWKPKSRRRDLIRAGALIVAEIERLDRAAIAKSENPGTKAGT